MTSFPYGVSNGERREFDFYPTPVPFIRDFSPIYESDIAPLFNHRLLDVGAGDGRWVNLYNNYSNFTYDCLDIQDWRVNAKSSEWSGKIREYYVADFLEFQTSVKYDGVVGNPPFNVFEKLWVKSLTVLKEQESSFILWLLPLTYLGGQWRKKMCAPHLERVYVYSKRIDFTGQNNPKSNIAMFLYRPFITFDSSELVIL